MRFGGGGRWGVGAPGARPATASGVWVIWRWWVERGDRQAEGTTRREERLAREVEAQRLSLSRDQAELFERTRSELVRCQTRLVELERDRARGWDLARYWHQRAHELRHIGLNAQAIVAGLCEREELPVPVWPDMVVVGFEEPR